MALTGLTPAVRTFLEEPRYAVIATINESGAPQLTAIWYELQGDEVLMNTAAGRLKHRNLQRDPRLTVCVVDGERYVTLYGRATLIDDQARAQVDDLHLAVRYDGPEAAAARAPLIAQQQRITIRMALTHVHPRGIE
jgi:PPOX class probable F420-dependent enzyme